MSPDRPSNIRVYVRWQDQVVFAGEEVKCTITFKNVARVPGTSSTPPGPLPSKPLTHTSRRAGVEGSRQSSPLHPPTATQGRTRSNIGLAPPPAARGHRSTLSLTVPSPAAASRAQAGSAPWSPAPSSARSPRNGHGHTRSVSIVSLGSATTVDDSQSIQSLQGNASSSKPQRPGRGHTRASSLQIVPRAPLLNGPRSATHPQRLYNPQGSPLFHASYPPDRSAFNGRPSDQATTPDTLQVKLPRPSPTRTDLLSGFRFPFTQSSSSPGAGGTGISEDALMMSPGSPGGDTNNLPVRSKDGVPTINEHGATLAARILSTTSIAGTPRSSGEFYSLSNNSSETLASEYVTQQPLRSQARSPHNRRTSNLTPSSIRAPETLMMGYAQLQGSFTLDGSLVNLGPFEQVKRKAVVGGQGGGVIGVETTKRDSGLLRGFGWGNFTSNFTSSIGELLGGGELSSIKEMRGIASSKSVPLLSTPQTILFVDLQLGPGESKTFEYSFRLPRGLPPTHRGKAMKISYSLVIGTQRPGGAREQQVKSVEIPFRVLGSVNNHGEILGHDLMTPYIILRDQARVQTIDKPNRQLDAPPKTPQPSPTSTMNSFVSYVDELLAGPHDGPNRSGLLSPSAMPSSRRHSTYSMLDDGANSVTTAKEAIDLAILRANMTGAGQQSANRFEIARNGQRVGVVMLARPAYRLGEAITMAIDFSAGEIPCYAVHAALETSERVDPSLALRSEASVHRVTRKVFVTASEATMYARRIVFTPTIPASATPEFVTSGVSLEWKIRLEFVVPAHDAERDLIEMPGEDDDDDEDKEGDGTDSDAADGRRAGGGGVNGSAGAGKQQPHPLLEEISRDDRGGLVLVAAENLPCESFEVAVPLRVYGAVCTGLEKLERDEASEEGLAV
ncbi:Rgp1-domain-containing protein [Podospora appendiculata]|uniref:Rgp1-domain-containing protein n=1 Tax=Podospora appendiculata TaxID=314037 RepID=A0AAE1C937_9PEZI|nr:Rgp1-domain-containing protein [Podospora appendiculata]